MSKKNTTYIVHLTSNSRYGANQDFYFRTEAEANRRAAELREQFKNTSQQILISSHAWINN